MSLFGEFLWKQFPNIDFQSISNVSINKLNTACKYISIYHTSIKLIYHIYFLPYDDKWSTSRKSFKNKFHVLDTVILKNKLITFNEKQYFLEKFMISQKIYAAFRKLANIYRYKYGKRFEIDADLCFNKFTHHVFIKTICINLLFIFKLN